MIDWVTYGDPSDILTAAYAAHAVVLQIRTESVALPSRYEIMAFALVLPGRLQAGEDANETVYNDLFSQHCPSTPQDNSLLTLRTLGDYWGLGANGYTELAKCSAGQVAKENFKCFD
ncbi:hypothetical protein EMWEY_00017500 [Eimeria maxima]|uniref:Uncharacterized protein n=1 Tax=Eimeria maxima TaxID=5804 RepID=U6LX89_EIMMA|nr:hypothetical protein EMWEY_00017500 [Eimeria maxima]CDJ56361.1 hypothetical protein EMWEY_00017500 [Eimeria maxima]